MMLVLHATNTINIACKDSQPPPRLLEPALAKPHPIVGAANPAPSHTPELEEDLMQYFNRPGHHTEAHPSPPESPPTKKAKRPSMTGAPQQTLLYACVLFPFEQ